MDHLRKPHFRHAIAHWPFNLHGPRSNTQELCDIANECGVDLDLVPQSDWEIVQKNELSMVSVLPDMGKAAPFRHAFNEAKPPKFLFPALSKAIDDAAEAGLKYVLVFSGYDTGEDRGRQFQRSVDGYTNRRGRAKWSLLERAKLRGITFDIEMLNTRGDAPMKGHAGYLANNTTELVEKVIKPIDDPNFLLAFDIYHSAMMEENVVDMIRQHRENIGLVHAAGMMQLPGEQQDPQNRGELTLEGQVIDVAAVGKALVRHLPAGTPLTYEWIPTSEDPDVVTSSIVEAMHLIEGEMPVTAS